MSAFIRRGMPAEVKGGPKQLGRFGATPGWEDLFDNKKLDAGAFYASKDNEYPPAPGAARARRRGPRPSRRENAFCGSRPLFAERRAGEYPLADAATFVSLALLGRPFGWSVFGRSIRRDS